MINSNIIEKYNTNKTNLIEPDTLGRPTTN